MGRGDIIDWIIAQEGGYSDNPDDPGACTQFGVSQRYLDSVGRVKWPNGNLPAEVKDLTQDQASMLYRLDQWAVIEGDQLPPGLALLVMDAAVNQGPGTAIRLLQQACGTAPDGIMGPLTLQAVKGSGAALTAEYTARRATAYAQFNAAEGMFELGWMRRLIAGYTKAITA
jgi:lysozyme family protein